jgi:hypothetical protein
MSEEYASFDGEVSLDLYQKWDTREEAQKGGLKTFKVTGDGSLIYDSDKSDYVVTVERVLGVDGWEKTTEHDEGAKTLMTLIILKIVVTRKKPDCRVRYVTATLSFENQKNGPKANPVVEAWAPFHSMELTNPMEEKVKKTDEFSGQAGLAYNGVDAHVRGSRKNEIAFKRTYYDTAFASARMNPDSGQRGGVMWHMEKSKIQIDSVPPETYAAVLFTRESDAEYVVRFDIDVGGGTMFDLRTKAKRAFGLGPGHTKPFLVQPSPYPKVRGEGRDFLPAVKKENLGGLRSADNSTELTIVRKSGERLSAQEEPLVKEKKEQQGAGQAAKESKTEGGEDREAKDDSFAEDDAEEDESGEVDAWGDEI